VNTLGDQLPKELERVRKLKAVYESLPGGAGMPAAWMMEQSLQNADRAMVSGDLVEMIRAYEDLKGFTE